MLNRNRNNTKLDLQGKPEASKKPQTNNYMSRNANLHK